MKKYLFGIFLLCVFFVPLSVHAETVLHQKEMEEGKIFLSLSSDDTGSVVTLHVSLQLEGNASLKSFLWDRSISSSYQREVHYQSATRTIEIIAATGGKENLIQEDGTIALGTLIFRENTTENPIYYNVAWNIEKKSPAQFVSYNYSEILPASLSLENEGTFILPGKKEEPKPDEMVEEPTPENEHQDRPPIGDSEKDLSSPTDDPVKEDPKVEVTEDDDLVNFDEEHKNPEEASVKEEHSSVTLYVLLGICAVVIIGGITIFLYRKKKIQKI